MKNYLSEIFNGLQYLAVAVQPNETLQYIQLGLSIITSAVIITFKLWRWWKDATADGKITADEIKEGAQIVEEGAEEINDEINKGL